jgi:hypothetical protein
LNLIADQQDIVLLAKILHFGEVALRRNNNSETDVMLSKDQKKARKQCLPRFTLNGFDKKSGNILAIQLQGALKI